MSRTLLHFSHANGFPAACYRKFFGCLESDFRISSINCIGHDPSYPVTDGWPHLVAQLLDYLSAHCRAPVVGVGHSLGGYLTFMAAVQRPELFKCIILLDAPIIGYFQGGGPASRSEVIFDATGTEPLVLFWRDMSHLGRGFALETLGIDLMQPM